MLIDTEFSDKKKAALDDSGTAFFLSFIDNVGSRYLHIQIHFCR